MKATREAPWTLPSKKELRAPRFQGPLPQPSRLLPEWCWVTNCISEQNNENRLQTTRGREFESFRRSPGSDSGLLLQPFRGGYTGKCPNELKEGRTAAGRKSDRTGHPSRFPAGLDEHRASLGV